MSKPLLVEAQAWQRVVQVRGEAGRPGTAVLLDGATDQYLVTAAHLTNQDQEEAILLTSPWIENGQAQTYVLPRVDDWCDDVDVAVFRMPEPIVGPEMPLPAGSKGIALSQEVLILGYPYRLELRLKGGPQVLPMVKRGIVGGMASDKTGPAIMFLDMVANPGFSGGPVIFRRQEDQKLAVAGIVKGTYTQQAVPEEGFPHDVSAAISIAIDIGYVSQLSASM